MAALSIGVDLGGTFIKAGLVDDSLGVHARQHVPTPSDQRPPSVVNAIVEVCQSLLQQSSEPVAAIGLGVPGPVDVRAGVVHACANLEGWRQVPVAAMLSERLGVTVRLSNDADAAAFGEYRAAAADVSDLQDALLITLGTGVGGGLVVNRAMVHGSGMAGEVGHMIVTPGGRPCGCGQLGCLERYASASAVLEQASQRMHSEPTDAAEVFAAAEAGDAVAQQILDEVGSALAVAAINVARLVDPQIIILGGGMSAAGEALRQRVEQAFAAQTWSIIANHTRITLAKLGNDAGFIGAAALAQVHADETCPTG